MAERKAALLVLGAGAWGTAIGSRLANDSGANVKLWSRSEELAKLINSSRVNQDYLPKIQLSELVKDMMQSDLKIMKKHQFLKNQGFDTLNYYEN